MSETINNPTSMESYRRPNGTFGPGSPGRKPGSRNIIAQETLHRIRDLRDPALQALTAKVLSGDMQAVALVLQYCLPRGRTVELPDASPDAIIQALTSGEISTEEARVIASAVEKLRKIRDLDEIEERLSAMEKLLRG